MRLNPIIAGNWKMHKTPNEGSIFVEKTTNLLLDINHVSVIFAPPFTGLFELDVNPPFYLAAQNCHWEKDGAFTGEISVSMIQECGAEYVILGHSERRHIFGETDVMVNRKVKSVLAGALKVILCIGETLEERELGQTNLVLKSQLEMGLLDLEKLDNIIIAYEPVWAIGTGLTANTEQVESAHYEVRKILKELFPNSDDIHVLYGGSVKPHNADELLNIYGVNGFLIGGASLDIESFTSITKTAEVVEKRKL